MILQNKLCTVVITIDEVYTIDSTDNTHHDIVHNPHTYKRGEFSNTFSILINRASENLRIALIGDCDIYDTDFGTLENDVLTILQNDTVVRLKVTDGAMILCKKLYTFG